MKISGEPRSRGGLPRGNRQNNLLSSNRGGGDRPRKFGRVLSVSICLFISLVLFRLSFCVAAQAEPARGWLNWRGPLQNGTSLEKNLPDKVDAAKPLWRADFPGQSTAVV